MQFTLGADPEVFVKRAGKMIPAGLIVPGSKEKPYTLMNGVSIHPDNVTMEFNVNYAHTRAEWQRGIKDAMMQCRNWVQKHDAEIVIKPAHQFTDKALESGGAEAMLFRCDPDIQAWEVPAQYKPIDKGWRAAGGHIHIGWEDPNDYTRLWVARACDIILGPQIAAWESEEFPTLARKRKQYYGLFGSFRSKEYGIEYRTPSNVWLMNDWRIQQVHECISMVMQNVHKMPRACHYYKDEVGVSIETLLERSVNKLQEYNIDELRIFGDEVDYYYNGLR